jgi:hypothetical protein
MFKIRRNMAVNNQPKDDAKAMTGEYVKGVNIDEIAAKYNHTAAEVEAIVTQPVTDEPTPAGGSNYTPTQDVKAK